MSRVAQYLQEHLMGEVITSQDAREYFSTDCSIFKIAPQIIVYPRIENDVRKAARFSWQLAERGRIIPITARGFGTDLSGGAIGSGIMLVFPAHMNKILTLDSKKSILSVQPGLNYGKLQQTLFTHGLFMPPYPSSQEYSSIGGAIANNAGGEKSIKYGVTRDYVRNLKVVLANGEIIQTGKLTQRELNKKMGLASLEGEIYRALNNLINDYKELINYSRRNLNKNNAGYNIWGVKDFKKDIFDLTPLFVGSQGTLGIVTEASINAEVYNPETNLIVGYFDAVDKAVQAVEKIRDFTPSMLEMVDENLLNFVDYHNPSQLKNIIQKPFPNIMLFIEFDDISRRLRRKKTKKIQKILNSLAQEHKIISDHQEQENFWKIRQSAAALAWQDVSNKKALPIIEDAIVPIEKLKEYFDRTYSLMSNYHLESAIWGHVGEGNLRLQPFFDLMQVSDRQKIFRLMNEYYSMVAEMGGSTTAEHNDGRLRTPYLKTIYGNELCELFDKIKQIFDPYGILNPGVKTGIELRELPALMRDEYTVAHLYDHMPRT